MAGNVIKHALVAGMVLMLGHAVDAADTKAPAEKGITAAVNPDVTTVGGLLSYRVEISGIDREKLKVMPPSERVIYPEPEKGEKPEKPEKENKPLPSERVPLYIIHSIKKEDRQDRGVDIVIEMSFYRPGKWSLPEVRINDQEGNLLGYRVPEIQVKELNPEGAPQDIEPPLDLRGNYYRLIALILGIAALTIAAVFAVRYFRNRGTEEEGPAAEPPIDVFMRGLEELDAERLVRESRIEEYAFGMSILFRKYLSLLLSFDAVEMTSDEIMPALQRRLPAAVFRKYEKDIGRAFRLWDLSKFAEFTPSVEILMSNLQDSTRLAQELDRAVTPGREEESVIS